MGLACVFLPPKIGEYFGRQGGNPSYAKDGVGKPDRVGNSGNRRGLGRSIIPV